MQLEELREDLINKGEELDRVRKERKKATRKVTKKKEKLAEEEKERRQEQEKEANRPAKQGDIDAIKEDIRIMKDERDKDRGTIEYLNKEASKLRHRLALTKKGKRYGSS